MKLMKHFFFLQATVFFLLLGATHSSSSVVRKIPLNLTQSYVYFATLAFGTNNQKLDLLVDTGSQNIAIFCDLCTDNCVPEQEYKTEESNEFTKLTCGVVGSFLDEPHSASIAGCLSQCLNASDSHECQGQIDYGGGDLTSYIKYIVSHDQVSLPSQTGGSFVSTFGCIYDSRNFQEGIWGLSLISSDNFLDQIHKTDLSLGINAQKVFTICTNSTDTVLNIGGVDPTYHIGEGVTIGVDNAAPQWWKLNEQQIGAFTIQDIIIRGPDTSFGEYGIILDSGTDFSILPTAIVTPLRAFIDDKCQSQDSCTLVNPVEIFQGVYKLTDAEGFFASMPTIKIQVGDKTLQTPISNYFWRLGENVWALGVVRAEKIGFPMSILGAIWMNNFDIVFDRSAPSVTIYDIIRCSEPSRLLTTQQSPGTAYDPYELPKPREQLNSYASLSKLKVKYASSLRRLKSQK